MTRSNKDCKVSGPTYELHIPWSSRESFTPPVCGLPDGDCGCYRWDKGKSLEHREAGIALLEGSIKPLDATEVQVDRWVGIQFPKGCQPNIRIAEQTSLPEIEGNQLWAGFAKDDVKFEKPFVLQLKLPNPGAEGTRAVGKLLAAIGSAVYEETEPVIFQGKPAPVELAGKRPSELVNRFLDHHCHRFRGHPLGREVGITLCHIECELAARSLLGRIDATFTFLDPSSWQLCEVRSHGEMSVPLSIGSAQPKAEKDLTADSKAVFKPVFASAGNAQSMSTRSQLRSSSFADCFCSWGREQILASETANSLLSFPLPEIQTFLLYWLLLRIFAESDNTDFIARFWDMHRRSGDSENLEDVHRLLATQVTLAPDYRVFEYETISTHQRHDFGCLASDKPQVFQDILSAIYLSPSNVDGLGLVCDYLSKNWQISSKERGLRNLPMYSRIDWKLPPAMGTARAKRSGEEMLLQILGLYRDAEGIAAERGGSSSAEIASAALESRISRCVFPIPFVLRHWPHKPFWTHYLITPIWEDVRGGEHRPVIFCHSFLNAIDLEEDAKLLQQHVLPLGGAIAAYFYDAIRREGEKAQGLNLLMGTIAHSALTCLVSADIKKVVSKLVDLNPPYELRFQTNAAMNKQDLTDLKRKILNLGYFEDRLRTLLSMVEMGVRTSVELPEKFQLRPDPADAVPFPISACLREAFRMLELARERLPRMFKEVSADPSEMGLMERIGLPIGYFSNVLVTTWIYEILTNVSIHGSDCGSTVGVPVHIAYEPRVEGGVTILIRNPIIEEDKGDFVYVGSIAIKKGKEDAYDRRSYLRYSSSLLCQFHGGVGIRSWVDSEGNYVTGLDLGRIRAEGIVDALEPIVSNGR